MAFCSYCGTQVGPQDGFCPQCGAPNPAGGPAPAAQPQPQAQPQYQAQPQATYTTNNYYAAPSKASTWDGGVLDTIVNAIIASLIMSITCGIATPWAVCYMMKFIVGHAVIDGKRMTFTGSGGDLFGQWIKWFLLTIITCGIYSFWVIPRMYKWIAEHIHAE